MTPFEINLVLQTTILAVVLVSMAFRIKGKFVGHLITMATAVVLGLTVAGIASPLFLDKSYTQTLMNPTLNLASFVTHAFFGIASFASGFALIAFLLRDRAVPGSSNLIAKIVTFLWILAYIVGLSLLLILH